MFAILISQENLPKIKETNIPSQGDLYLYDVYLRHREEWYFVRGYISPLGRVVSHTMLPGYIIRENFEHDPNKIRTDWDQIVRK